MVKGIDKLIICNPYEMPIEYYQYDSERDMYCKTQGRRPSGYQSMSEDGKYGIHNSIDSVNKIRPYVDKWRESNYVGSTETTKQLLRHWRYRDESRLFFCQLEAIETIIYASEHPNIVNKFITGDSSAFIRYCTKMATGTGKTIVMGMLIVWQVLNTGKKYTKNILVVTPNLTVKDRLQDLYPGNRDNVYEKFDLVPAGYASKMGSSHIVITNFHQLKPKRSKSTSVEKLGVQGARSFAASILGRNTSNVLVINDEGHHAWRPSEYTTTDVDSKEAERAGTWMSGLDLIHEACTIMQCHDFSATPFVPTGKSSTYDDMFKWIISDFSLADAIESGLVKTPYTPRHGDRFYHLYRHEDVSASLKKGSIPNIIKDAYHILGTDWLNVNKKWSARSTPPVMITICNSTKHAKLVVDHIKNGKFLLNVDLVKSESLLHIDTEAIKAINSEDGRRDLRDMVSSVGKPNSSGKDVCNIVSVDMLTEGWDAKTVTHIMGLRAFKSQLLCEQVVGRGLRRTSYDLNSDGLFESEGVCVLGVPFAGILSEMEPNNGGKTGSPKPPVEIHATRPKHRIGWPIVTKIQSVITIRTKINWNNITLTQFEHTPTTSVNLGPLVDGWVKATDTTITPQLRLQTITYGILQDVIGNMRRLESSPWIESNPYNENPLQSTIDMLAIVKRYISKYVKTRLDENGLIKMLVAYRDDIGRDIFSSVVKPDPKSKPKAIIVGIDSTDMSGSKFTTKSKRLKPKKTHLNIMTADSDLELTIGKELERNSNVISWAKSDMSGFAVPYVHPDNTERTYRPDFIAHLDTGVTLVLEGKGKEDDVDKAKKDALCLWVDAVNREEQYGLWHSSTIYAGDNVQTKLEDVIRLTREKKYNQYCHICGIKTNLIVDAIKEFGLEKRHGLLKIHTCCKKCRSDA